MRVVVVGAGVVGTCAAYRLARTGASVTLLGADPPERTLSAHSFAWVNPVDDGNADYWALTHEAQTAHRRLAAEIPTNGFHPAGNLHWTDRPEAAAKLLEAAASYRAKGWAAAQCTPRAARRLEPALRIPDDAGPVVHYPDDGYVFADRFLDRLRAAGQRHGLRVRLDAPVAELAGDSVRLVSGERITADAVVCCAGRTTARLLAGCGYGLPLVDPNDSGILTRGLLVRTSPMPPGVGLGRVVHAPGLSIRPHHGGRLVLRCQEVDVRLPQDTAVAAAAVLARLPEVLPAAAGVTVEAAFAGVRPMPRDGRSIVGPLPGQDKLYVIVTHSGLTLGPLLGEIAAREVTGGGTHELAGAFRLGRFAPA